MKRDDGTGMGDDFNINGPSGGAGAGAGDDN